MSDYIDASAQIAPASLELLTLEQVLNGVVWDITTPANSSFKIPDTYEEPLRDPSQDSIGE